MKRPRIDTIAPTFASCIQGRRRTRIMFRNSLSDPQLDSDLVSLASKDLSANHSHRYMATQKGRHFLEAFGRLNNSLIEDALSASVTSINKSYKEKELAYTE